MFTQKEELDQLNVKCDTGAEMTLYFESGIVDFVHIDGHEYEAIDDIVKNIFVKIKGEFYTLLGVIQKANADYDEICEETKKEMSDDSDMYNELSSPRLTGRV